jgi:2'-5' RNA ligase
MYVPRLFRTAAPGFARKLPARRRPRKRRGGVVPFRYADTTSWQEWQREYRYGALYIFPPPGVVEPIDALRMTYDPASARSCQAHVSLSEPLRRPLTDAAIDELRSVLARFEPFTIEYGPLRTFPPYPGVTLAIRPEGRFMALRSLVHTTSPFAGGPFERQEIAPHMTIAEFISRERTDELTQELKDVAPSGTFWCDAIEYAVPDERLRFERVLTLPLGRAG